MACYIRDQTIELASRWKGGRFKGGRPRVPNYLLEKLQTMTIEEAWLSLFFKDYKFQFEGEIKGLHDKLKLTGKAVTAILIPTRPDLMGAVGAGGDARRYKDTCNQWVVDHLQEGDVVVTDMFDKVWNGTFVDGNPTAAINVGIRTGGAVIRGGVHDIEQMQKTDTQVYHRGTNPIPVKGRLMTSYSKPVKTGKAVCMSGDIAMGITSGILSIPAYLVEKLVNNVEESYAKNILGSAMSE